MIHRSDAPVGVVDVSLLTNCPRINIVWILIFHAYTHTRRWVVFLAHLFAAWPTGDDLPMSSYRQLLPRGTRVSPWDFLSDLTGCCTATPVMRIPYQSLVLCYIWCLVLAFVHDLLFGSLALYPSPGGCGLPQLLGIGSRPIINSGRSRFWCFKKFDDLKLYFKL